MAFAMAFIESRQGESTGNPAAYGGSMAVWNGTGLTSRAGNITAGNLLTFAGNIENAGTGPVIGTIPGWTLIGTKTDVANTMLIFWAYRFATSNSDAFQATLITTAECNCCNQLQEVSGFTGGTGSFHGGSIAAYPSSGHGTEPSPGITTTGDAFYWSWACRSASYTYYVSPAEWTGYGSADNSPSQSFAGGYYFDNTGGTGTVNAQATWAKGNSFYFDIGIAAFFAVGGGFTGITRDKGINRGIARGIF